MIIYTIHIIYKSGAVMDFKCTEFKYERDAFGKATASWKLAPGAQIRPIHMNLDEIAALWQIDHQEVPGTQEAE